jgi:hypothetical protein
MVMMNKKKRGGGSYKFVWQNISPFPTSQETFGDVYGPQFNTAELDVMNTFENISDIALVQLNVNETNIYAKQGILKTVSPFTFRITIRK